MSAQAKQTKRIYMIDGNCQSVLQEKSPQVCSYLLFGCGAIRRISKELWQTFVV